MSGFAQKLRLKGMAEEDIWFARRERELIESLQKKRKVQASARETDKNSHTGVTASSK